MTSPILLTGGTGTLGSHVVPLLRAAGREVRVLSRTPHESTDGVSYVVGDLATGAGLVDAARAVLIAKLRCRPIGPVPITPITPIPITPITPVTPIRPILPIAPVGPVGPVRPIAPVVNPGPVLADVDAPPPGPGMPATPTSTVFCTDASRVAG